MKFILLNNENDENNVSGECQFLLQEVNRTEATENEEEEEETEEEISYHPAIRAYGTWHREKGTLDLKMTFGKIEDLDIGSFKDFYTYLVADDGQVKGKLSTDPSDGTPFAIVLEMPGPDYSRVEGADVVTTPWIFNCFQPGELSLVKDTLEEE